MADENFRELEQEQAATGTVDAGDFEGNAGTGLVAEEQETAIVDADSTTADEAVMMGGGEQNIPPMPAEPLAPSAEGQVDLHEKEPSGLDAAVIVVLLLIIIAGISYAIWDAGNAPAQQTVAQQQAAQQQTGAQFSEPPFEVAELPEGVAAVVNGEEIPEADITQYVADFRELYDLNDDDAWAQWLVSSGYTADSLRNSAISMFVDDALVAQAVAELDVQVTDGAVQEIYDATRSGFDTDEEWQEALEGAGFTDETFREQCKSQAQQRALMELLADSAYTDEDLNTEALEYIKTYYPEYADASSLDEVDGDIANSVREMMGMYAQQEAYTAYLDNAVATGDIEMSAAPKDLPYEVNLLPFYFQNLFAQAQGSQQQ